MMKEFIELNQIEHNKVKKEKPKPVVRFRRHFSVLLEEMLEKKKTVTVEAPVSMSAKELEKLEEISKIRADQMEPPLIDSLKRAKIELEQDTQNFMS